jgi:hypothetical protein
MGVKSQVHFLARDKAIKSNSKYKDGQYIYIYRVPIIQGQEVFGVISQW